MEPLSESEEREVGQYEDLRSYANRMTWTIKLQVRRLREALSDGVREDDFVFQPVSEAEFLIVSLDRLLAASCQISKMVGALDDAVSEYRRASPNLRAACTLSRTWTNICAEKATIRLSSQAH